MKKSINSLITIFLLGGMALIISMTGNDQALFRILVCAFLFIQTLILIVSLDNQSSK